VDLKKVLGIERRFRQLFLGPKRGYDKWVWHRRLGHANLRLISKLSKLQLVKGLPNIDYQSDALCGACQRGKIVKSSF